MSQLALPGGPACWATFGGLRWTPGWPFGAGRVAGLGWGDDSACAGLQGGDVRVSVVAM